MSTVHIAGGAMTPFNRRKDGSSFRDWARAAFDGALADAGLGPSDIDGLVIACESDFFTLQINPAALLADELGLTGIAALRVEGGGASGHLAVHAGAAMVASSQCRRVAVLGVEPSASHLAGTDVSRLYGLSFDAWSDGMTGIDATTLYGLSAQVFMDATGATTADFAAVAVRNRRNALSNPMAHLPLDIVPADVAASPLIAAPYRRLDCSPLSDGAACVILAQAEALPHGRRGRARLAGMGTATDRVRLGERRDPGRFAAKATAAKKALHQAGIQPSDVALAEVYDSYSGAQLQALDALGLSADVVSDERAGRFAREGKLPVNLSGGLLGQGAPVGAVGVAQILACALQIEGRYFGAAPDRRPAWALADTHGGIATLCAVSILAGDAR